MSYPFVSGMITMGYVVAGVFFLRFWVRTRDLLFGAFAIAFWLLALNQAITAMDGGYREEQSWVYLLRVAGFSLIILSILQKNLSGRRDR